MSENKVSLRDQVITVLKTIIDPEVGMDLWTLETIEDLEVDEENNRISLKFKPTSPFCPLGAQLAFIIKDKLMRAFPDHEVDVLVTAHVQQDLINKALKEYKVQTLAKEGESK